MAGSDRDPPDLDETASAVPAALDATIAKIELAGPDFADFVVQRRLGSGGMGVVYLAQDSTLDRLVAIKLIRPGARHAEALRARLLREARTLSKVTHPNVVTVYGAGLADDQVYIVMEYVDGGTLADWMTEKKRTQREIVDVLGQAGRGLAAAHRAGLVHRDFKPANILVGNDGRARVTDFGLAQLAAAPPEESSDAGAPPSPSMTLTAAGTIVGTPRYMAPEQHERSTVGPAADQFAFGVTLFEALAGVAPFPGSSTEEVRGNILAGKIRQLPNGVPAWLAAIVRRALERDPARRYPSMDALLAALTRGPLVTPRRIAAAAVVAGALAAISWGVVASRREPPCRGADKIVAAAWGPTQRAALAAAFHKAKIADAPDMLARVTKRVDDYAAAWTSARTEACEATAVRHEQSGATLDLRMDCLDRRLAEMRGVIDVLSHPENITPIVTSAPQAMGRLADCSDAAMLAGQSHVPPDQRVAYNAQVMKLTQSYVLGQLGNLGAARKATPELIADARRAGFPDALAETLYVASGNLDDDPHVLDWLNEALTIAADTKDDKLVALIQMRLFFILGIKQQRFVEAMALYPVATAAVRRIGNGEGMQTELLSRLGTVQFQSGQIEESIKTQLEARVHAERGWGKESIEVAECEQALTEATSRLGRFAEARGYAEHALAIVDAQAGPSSYSSGRAHNELGGIAVGQGDFAAARLHYGRAKEIMAHQLGPDSPMVALLDSNLAEVDEAEGHFAEAQPRFEAALAAFTKRRGPMDVRTGWMARNLARVLVAQGKLAEAKPFAEQALAAHEKIAPDHPDVADDLLVIGRLRVAEGAPADAVTALERAVAIKDKAGGADVRLVLIDLGRAYHAAGRAADAVRVLERAEKLIDATTPPVEAADARFTLARALGRGAERARTLAADARAAYATAGRDKLVAEVDGWLPRR
jgi:tetratricopeptide (TPR) repeat protein/predicted Ser/Thr protein kinase